MKVVSGEGELRNEAEQVERNAEDRKGSPFPFFFADCAYASKRKEYQITEMSESQNRQD